MIRPVRHFHPAARARGVGRALLTSALTLIGAACSDSSTAVAPVGHLSLGKGSGGGGPSVSSASPAYSHRDTTLDVRILGSGFTAGAAAQWSLSGVADPAKIKTNSTQVVSSSELIANITVSADADLAFWDITVSLIGGKKGVGTEKFEVTAATILGAGTIGGDMRVEATNDLLSVVGYAGAGNAFVYDSHSAALVALGSGQAWGIDPSGTMALGRDGNFMPVVWERGSGGSWTRQSLPSAGNDGIANRTAVGADGSLLASGWLTIQVSRRESNNQPVLWRHANGSWDAPVYYTFPGTAAAAYDVASGGQMAGRTTLADGSVRGVVWDGPNTHTLLDGIAYAINDAATIVVGERAGRPVYWYRDALSGWSTVGIALPALGGACDAGRARDVNNSGIIVGSSCNPNGKRQATVWKLDLVGATPVLVDGPIGLGGLGFIGSGAETSFASGVTTLPPYVAVGGAVANGGTVLVSWQIP
ncbi:MAG: hypothetical protein K0S86_1070 [Geminicoccaceae bacterium]|nr:hypothetical protein [Geminicoccaceae bacterium]